MFDNNYCKNTKTLTIPFDYCGELINIPYDVEKIIFSENDEKEETSQFNNKIGCMDCQNINCPRNLPNTLKYLITGGCFNQSVDNLPNSITHLSLGTKVPIGEISEYLQQYYTMESFNQSVDNLPLNLTNLTFGDDFNQSVDNLPSNIKVLTFGISFNQPVNKLPLSILELNFGYKFNQPVNNLPLSILELNFGNKFNQSIENLPLQIKKLSIGVNFNQSIDNLPTNINCISFYSHYKYKNNLPLHIEYLIINFSKRKPKLNSSIDNININVQKIKIKKQYIKYLTKIPYGCKIIN